MIKLRCFHFTNYFTGIHRSNVHPIHFINLKSFAVDIFIKVSNLPGGPGGPGGPSMIPVGKASPANVVVKPLSPLSPLSP